MTKLLIIKERGGEGLLNRILNLIFESDRYEYVHPSELLTLLNELQPDFVLYNINKPVSGNDLMSMVSELDELSRLRVLYIKLFRLRKPAFLSVLALKHFSLPFFPGNKSLKKSS
jgi:hypothetical protein